jgi:membrane-bound lytic murein transglycosylase D
MVESAFNPMAHSPAQASGLWQFIPSTGRNYNLAQNFWVDQRRDIVASTQAALDYLQTIYEMHGDWHLALASYNWGENAVARAIQKNLSAGLPTDYQSLNMPNETRYYVPKLQALKNIIAQPQVFGISLPKIPNRPYFATVETRGAMDIATAARLANMSMAEFNALNPAYNRPLLPHHSGGSILIPAQNVDQYFANLDAHGKPVANWGTYAVSRNEKLETVAAKYKIPVSRLRQINGLSPRAKLAAGQTLLVPTGGQTFSPDPPVVTKIVTPTVRSAAPKRVATKAQPAKRTANASRTRPQKVAKKPAPKPVAKRNTGRNS